MNRFSDQNLRSLAIDTALPLSTSQNFAAQQPSITFTNAWARQIIVDKLSGISGGEIFLSEGGRYHQRLGDDNAHSGSEESSIGLNLTARLKVVNETFYRRTLLGGTIGAAESYIDGDWGTDNLTHLIRILIRNMDDVSKLEQTWSKARSLWHRLMHLRRKNTVGGSRKNIQQHYDLGNEFYSLFLDPTMNYSAGIFDANVAKSKFPNCQSQLHAASLTKMDRICEKLKLCPDDHVIEIGTGWGGMAIHMAKHYRCRVTTTTISKEQFDFAVEAIAKEGLQDRVTVLQKDYRDLEGTYDKLVSVEMIEAVGHQFLDTYFAKCNALLKPQGTMLIQAILIGQQYERLYRKGVDFIRAYVFPGGCLPSAASIAESVGRVTSMRMVDFEDMSQHYADTLMHWREAFMDRLDAVRSLGFDDGFVRLWHFYLCYCEAAFAERRCQSVQVMFGKKDSPVDPVAESWFS